VGGSFQGSSSTLKAESRGLLTVLCCLRMFSEVQQETASIKSFILYFDQKLMIFTCFLMTTEVQHPVGWGLFFHYCSKALRCADGVLWDYSIALCLLSLVAQFGLLICFSNTWLAPLYMTDQWIHFQVSDLFIEVFVKRKLKRFYGLHVKYWKIQSDCEDSSSFDNRDFFFK